MRVAIDLKLFEELEKADRKGVTVAELAKACNADTVLLTRAMKHLAAMHVVDEKSEDHYAPTSLSTALTDPKYRDGIVYNYDGPGPSFHHLPVYLKSTSYTNPVNPVDGPFQYAHKTSSHFFPYVAERPELLASFNNYMSGYRAGKAHWSDRGFYPVDERLAQGAKTTADGIFLVDVGGGLGHDIQLLKQKHPKIPGKLILQDKADVIGQITATDLAFEKTVHDFFTPQPVHGARAFYLHSVLHDWDDASSVSILKNIALSMEKDYSKVLVNDFVVPNQGATWSTTSMDWLMMVLGAVKERSENDWRSIIEQAGLKVSGIWTNDQGTESLIECELA